MEKPRRRWRDNIGMDLKKARCAQNFSISEDRPVAGSISNRNTLSNSKTGEGFLDKLRGPYCIKTGGPARRECHEIFGPKCSTVHMQKKTDILYDSLINQFQTQLSKY